jgi:hypothetical protein
LKYFVLYLSTPANSVLNIKSKRFPEERNATPSLSLIIVGGEFWEGESLRIVHESGTVAVADVLQAVL